MESSRRSRRASRPTDDSDAEDTGEFSPDDLPASTGRRRSNYLPPESGLRMPGAPEPIAPPSHIDDDELASALAAQLTPYRHTASTPIVNAAAAPIETALAESAPIEPASAKAPIETPLRRPRTNRSAPVDEEMELDWQREAERAAGLATTRPRSRHRLDASDDVVAERVTTASTDAAEIGSAAVDTSGVEPAHYEATSDLPQILRSRPRARQPVPELEESGLGPTRVEERLGRATRMFWLWFAANSSVVSVGLGAVVFSLGLSLRQALVAVFVGIALSFLPLGLGTLAGKRSGQPTMVVSRATFGIVGNVLPAAIAVVSRLFWGAVLLWLMSMSSAKVLITMSLNAGLNERQLTVLSLALGGILALVIAFFGYRLLARVQLIVTIVSGILIAGLIAATAPAIDMSEALSIADGPWARVATAAVLVFSFVGLLWANSSGDLARYQRPSGGTGASMLWAAGGATVPAFVLLVWGVLLSASDPLLAASLVVDPMTALGALLPGWYPLLLIAAVSFSLLSGVSVVLYSGAFAVQAVGVRVGRQSAVVILAFALSLFAVALTLFAQDFDLVYRDLATTIAVPVAAWVGIFTAELMIRARRFDAQSLLHRGGAYADFRWLNLGTFIVVTGIGFGLTSASPVWLAWQGYLYPMLGFGAGGDVAGSDIGVVVALVLGAAVPLALGVPSIRAQESAAIDERSRARERA